MRHDGRHLIGAKALVVSWCSWYRDWLVSRGQCLVLTMLEELWGMNDVWWVRSRVTRVCGMHMYGWGCSWVVTRSIGR